MKNSFFKLLKKTYRYADKKERINLYLFIFFALIMCALQVILPVLLAKQIIYLTSSVWHQLFLTVIMIVFLELLYNILRYYSNKCINIYYLGMKKNMELALARETLRICEDDMNSYSSGMFVQRITTDVDTVADIFVDLIDYVTAFITSFGVLIAVFFLNKVIFLLYLLFVIILTIVENYQALSLQKARKENREISDAVTGFSTELVRGSKDIKLLNAEDSFLKKADTEFIRFNKSNYKVNLLSGKFRLISASLWDLVDFGMMLIGIIFLLTKSISVPVMLIIMNYKIEILRLSDIIEYLIESIKKYKVSSERIFDILEGKVFKKELFGEKHINKLKGYIEFKDVSFSYKKGSKVLDRINFKIRPNQTVSFVGKSGAGKTTIYNLISKLYNVDSGEILLDDISIKDLDKSTIRKNISVISQNPYIFNMSIKDNLKVVRDVSDDEIISACKAAQLHNYIITLKDGYDTVVGEGGVMLSGGQKQRLAIARALIQNTEIILFDEATSALDNLAQAQIQKAINNMQGTYTILIIAHRLSTVINSDKIFLIEDGKIVDSGTHKELLNKNDKYNELYKLELK